MMESYYRTSSLIYSIHRHLEHIMTNKISLTWTSLQLALAGASTYVVCSTDLLRGASLFIH